MSITPNITSLVFGLICCLSAAGLLANPDSSQLVQPHVEPLNIVDDITSLGEPLGVIKDSIEKVRGWIADVKEHGKYVDSLLEEAFLDLPVGMLKMDGNIAFTLGINHIRLHPTHSEIDLFLEIDLPDQDQDPIFIASGVTFSRKGGLSGDVELYLLGNFPIDLRKGKSKIILQGKTPQRKGTYVKVDCNGFKELNIEGTVVFSRDWLIPLNSQGIPLTDSLLQVAEQNGVDISNKPRVQADFSVNGQTSWNILAELEQITPFAPAQRENIHIYAEQLALDLSETANPAGLGFPAEYNSPFVVNGQALNLWKGVYIKKISVRAPSLFSDNPSASPIEVLGQHFIIDDQGFTGQMEAHHLLPLTQGKVGTWAASVDTLRVDIMAMQVREARMAGLIHLPLFSRSEDDTDNPAPPDEAPPVGPEDCLGYTLAIQAGNRYLAGVRITKDYSASVWNAHVRIAANSRVDVLVDNGDVSATATLHGDLSIEDDFSSIALVVDTLTFNHLQVSTRRPFLRPGVWGLPQHITAYLGRFSLNFSEIYLQVDSTLGQRASLEFNATVQIAGGHSPIAAGGSFGIEGELTDVEGRHRWQYDRLRVDGLWVEASTSSWGLAGQLIFYEEDPHYGTGFRGQVGVWFAGVSPPGAAEDPGAKGFQAVAQFGQMPDGGGDAYRYFFVDVMAQFGNGLPLGTLQLMALGGGVYNRMAPQNAVSNLATPAANVSALGSSLSGIVYRPDRSRGLRIKASLVVACQGSKEAFSVNGTLEVVTNASGGLDTVAVYGNVTMFGPIEWDNTYTADQTGVTIYINMLYDNVGEERGFTASAVAFVNVANGKFKGNAGGMPNYAGGLDLKFTNQTWYVNVGTPMQPLSLAADFGFVSPTLTAYLDIGNNIPPMPDLPAYVTQIAGGSSNFMRNESLYATGAGFAFGVAATVPPQRKNIFPFYYELAAGLGFDIMLQNYKDAHCANTNSGRLGINGWYASGQAWAYLSGSVGIRVDLLFVKGEFEILAAALAAVLQAKGPNPFWGSARVAARYRILGGLVKGNCRIKVEVGKECLIVGEGSDPMANIDLILNLSPGDSTDNHLTTVQPSAISNLPFGETIELNEQAYKLVVLASAIRQNDQEITSLTNLISGDNYLEEIPKDMLPGDSELTYQLDVALLKKNGTYFTDTVKIEEHQLQFQTGPGFDTIPDHNVLAAYPLRGQRNFYPQEYHSGYLKLRQGQPDLLQGSVQARFTSATGSILESAVSYNLNQKELTFSIPDLSPDTYYHLEIVRQADPLPDQQLAPDGNEQPGQANPSPPPDPSALAEAIIYQNYFRTSHFATFVEKIESWPKLVLNRFGRLVVDPPTEPFGTLELQGNTQTDPLIDLETDITDNDWFASHQFQSLVYDPFPINQGLLQVPNTWRGMELGEVPVRAVQLSQDLPPLVDEASFTNSSNDPTIYADTLQFDFPFVVYQDYQNYKQLVDSMLYYWADREAYELNQYDGDAIDFAAFDRMAPPDIVDQADLLYVMKLYCFNPDSQRGVEAGDCPNFSGEIPICPLPCPLRNLHQASPITLGDLRGKNFRLKFQYFLPGRPNSPNSTAMLPIKFQGS